MKILIATDMEGITGVVDWDQVSPDHSEYPRFRELMTQDVNSAVHGALEAGADEIVVTDGHAYGRNLLIEDLDARVRLHMGSPSPLSMVSGVDGADGVMFVGYHAMVGTEHAILDHTWSSTCVANLWLNGELVGETGLNAAICGHFDVPPLMVSGDQAVCDEAREQLGDVEIAVVKWATSRMAAFCLPPVVAQGRIYDAAHSAVTRLKAGQVPRPFRLAEPVELVVELQRSEMADGAASLPGVEREGRRITYTAPDVLTAFNALRAILALAR